MILFHKFKNLFFLFVICCITLLFRYNYLGDRGLAGDEKYTVLVSQFLVQEGSNQPESIRNKRTPYFTPKEFWTERTFKDFLESMARRENGSGALYFYSLHLWTKIFGVSDFSIRFPSLLFSILLLPLLFYFTKRHFQNTKYTPYLVTIFAAISPFYFNYAIIARNYMMTYFLALLATFFFANFIKSNKKYYKTSSFWLYSVTLSLMIFGHHSLIVVIPIHFLILLFSKSFQKIIPFCLASILPISLLFLWSISEGGKYTIDFVKNSNIQYLKIAASNTDVMVQKATFYNIASQWIKVISYLYIPWSGLGDKLVGIKNILLCITSGLSFGLALLFIKNKFQIIASLVVLLVPFFIYTIFKIEFLIVSIGISSIVVFLYLYIKNFNRFEWQLIVFLSFIPSALLVVYALMDGITMRIHPRYAGFAYPFLLICFVVSLEYIFSQNKNFKPVSLIFLLFLFCYVIVPENSKIISDNQPKYFHHTAPKRGKNIHKIIADKILTIYEPGDTVLYNSPRLGKLSGTSAMPDYSMQDAQYVNIYLPKISSIIQRGDTLEQSRIYIWKYKSKNKVLIQDFNTSIY